MRRLIPCLALTLASVPQPAWSFTLPDPASNPAVIAAARNFVGALPIHDSIAGGWIVTGRVVQSLAEEAVRRRSGADIEQMARAIWTRVDLRIGRLLPEIWPSLEEEIALAFARSIWIEGLNAGAEFYRTPGGRVLALRTVAHDPIITEIAHRHLLARLSPELDAILLEAEEGERLRERINSRRR